MVGTCQWTKDGLSVDGVSRYQLQADRTGLCDITIDPVLPLDEGVYQCQVSGGHGVAPISSAPVSLSVNSEPGQPYIVQAMEDGVMEVKEGEEVELQCESQGGRPPAEIQWWDGDGKRIVSDVTEHVKRMEDRKTFKTVSVLKLMPSEVLNIKCSAHNDAFPNEKMSLPLLIEFRGHPKLEVKELEDGDSVKIVCATSDDSNIKWSINDVEIFDETKSILEIENFSKSYDKSKVKCSVKDLSNVNFEVVTIVQLLHKPKSETNPKTLLKMIKDRKTTRLSSRAGKQITDININKKKTMFTCIIEEEVSAEPKYVWMDGKLRNVTPDENVDATNQKKKYKCKVIPKGTQKIVRMSKDMKKISKAIRKFSKILSGMTSPIDDT
jgi:hypothetical protein